MKAVIEVYQEFKPRHPDGAVVCFLHSWEVPAWFARLLVRVLKHIGSDEREGAKDDA